LGQNEKLKMRRRRERGGIEVMMVFGFVFGGVSDGKRAFGSGRSYAAGFERNSGVCGKDRTASSFVKKREGCHAADCSRPQRRCRDATFAVRFCISASAAASPSAATAKEESSAKAESTSASSGFTAEDAEGSVRVRFAPSPTGSLHVGGARTALYNWLAAKKAKEDGRFIIRVEDTDLARSTRESELEMLRDLKWLGLQCDEGPDVGGKLGPYRQSERGELYVKLANKLLEDGLAYKCFCTEEELEQKRLAAEEAGVDAKYDGEWRDASAERIAEAEAAGKEYTVRFRVPAGARVEIDDLVRGNVAWDAEATVGDFILLRSSGVPVYNFCVAVDDALMRVSTVVRAEEHLTNTLRQVLILRALGFEAPQYAHCSLILGEDRSKLSKRHGATSVNQFREQGFLADAMVNYLALLGWSPGDDREIFSRDELIEEFDLARIVKSPAVFDMSKLRWLNGQHLRKLSQEELLSSVAAALSTPAGLVKVDGEDPTADSLAKLKAVQSATELFREAMELTIDARDLLAHAFSYPLDDTMESGKVNKIVKDEGFHKVLGAIVSKWNNDCAEGGALAILADVDASDEDALSAWKAWVKSIGKEAEVKGRKLFQPLRLCLTGSMQGRDVGGVVRVLALASAERLEVQGQMLMQERIEKLKQLLEESQSEPAE